MHRARRITMLGSAAAIAIAAPAFAQASQESGPQGSSETGIPEIIVTAQRREQVAQDVPVVVTAFSSERLATMSVTEPQDLYGNVPSLAVGTQGQATRDVQSYSIRGQSTGFLASPAVAVYINEVPVPAAISLNLQGGPGTFYDLENVQVLSGPQGTLFGRNTTGGAVLLTPHKPTDKLGGYVEGSIGNYDLRAIEGAINIPVSDKLKIRVSGAYRDRRGYTRDVVWDKWRDDEHWYAGRIGILFEPADGISNYLLAYGSKSSNNGSGHIHKQFNIQGLKLVGFCADPPAAPVPGLGVSCDVYRRQGEIAQDLGIRKTAHDVDGFSRISTWGIINTTDIELNDQLTLRNIASFQKLKDNYATDQDATPIQQYELLQNAALPSSAPPGLAQFGLPLFGTYTNAQPNFDFPRDSIRQWTEELQVQGNYLDNRLNFTAGAFYYNATPDELWGTTAVNYCPALFTGLCRPSESYTGSSNKSKALYAQATLDLGAFSPSLDTLRVTGGYRYTWDTIDGFAWGYRFDTTTPGNVICNVNSASVPFSVAGQERPVGCRFSDRLKSSAPTWTIGLDYKPLRDVLVYAKVTRGYKSGGFNTFAVRPTTTTFQPEKLTSYEAGFKSDWRLGSMPLRLNATYFYSDYSNIQRASGDVNGPASGAQVLAAKATIQGLEVEASISPTKWLQIGTTLSHTDADYKTFQQIAVSNNTPTCNGTVNIGDVADYSCRPFQYVTPWIYNINATLKLPVPEQMGEVSLFVNYLHVAGQATAPLADAISEPGSVLPSYGLLNANLSWKNIAQTGVDASIFVNNLLKKEYVVSNSNIYSIGQLLSQSQLYGEPRMFGLKLRYSFGE